MMKAQLALKRLFDVVICSLVLVLGLPVFGLIGLMVKLSSPGPVFFVQERVGLGGKTFRMIKFRTMVGKPTAEPVMVWTEAEEARVTKIGRFLRDYALDELPEVFNILKGDMSIIGPRPPLPAQVQDYTEHQRQMFLMRPGMLSWAFVEGRRSIPMEQRIEYHVWYVENWSLWLDVLIFWRGLLVLLKREGASEKIVTSERTANPQ